MVAAIIYLILVVVMAAGAWKAYEKMGRQGWEGIIPIYNIFVACRLTGRPDWWIVLFFIPLVNFYAMWVVLDRLSKDFGGDLVQTLILFFLPFAGWPMLGFGAATYKPQASAN